MGEATSGNYQLEHPFLNPKFKSLEGAARPHLTQPLPCLQHWRSAMLASLCCQKQDQLLPTSHSALCAWKAPPFPFQVLSRPV